MQQMRRQSKSIAVLALLVAIAKTTFSPSSSSSSLFTQAATLRKQECSPECQYNTEVNTEEDNIENYLQVYYLENNIRRQFPNFNIFNSYIGTLLSSYVEHEIILVEKKDLDLIPLGAPMNYNTR